MIDQPKPMVPDSMEKDFYATAAFFALKNAIENLQCAYSDYQQDAIFAKLRRLYEGTEYSELVAICFDFVFRVGELERKIDEGYQRLDI